jgi:hypothetical protein
MINDQLMNKRLLPRGKQKLQKGFFSVTDKLQETLQATLNPGSYGGSETLN